MLLGVQVYAHKLKNHLTPSTDSDNDMTPAAITTRY